MNAGIFKVRKVGDMEWYSRSIICVIIAALAAGAAAGPLNLKVVYPKPEQAIPAVDSTFIFGSVDPAAELTVNGHSVPVHKGGGWLAYLPVQPGPFAFRVRAVKNGVADSLTIPVTLPPLNSYDFDHVFIDRSSLKPSAPLWIRPGDEVTLSFASIPYGNAFCLVQPSGDTIPMRESPPRPYYSGPAIFELPAFPGSQAEEGYPTPVVRGLYEGSFRCRAARGDTLTLIYHLYPPSLPQIVWLIRYGVGAKESIPVDKLLGMPPIIAETSAVAVSFLSMSAPRVVELTDSLTVIRSGPGKGYLCTHQPAGIRAELAGRDGNWLKLRLSECRYGWVPDTAATILPPGTVIPHSYVNRVRTVGANDKVTVIVGTATRHPFQVVENLDEKSLTVLIFGADGNTDWIRYDSADTLVDQITWFQPETGVYGLKIYLATDRIWGYDACYQNNEFCLNVKKSPLRGKGLAGLRFVIDPGHSPEDGAVGPTGLKEKDVNLAVAQRLKQELEQEGAAVILTRADDSPLPLYDRPKVGAREKADIFISIHHNALPDGVNPFVNNGVSSFYYHSHSADLARAVQQSLAKNLGLKDFGWYYGNFAVTRATQYPAILVESAFMMIPEQESLLKTDDFRGKIAEAIVAGVKEFLDSGR
jgi:N-acetylmuramoyl-L-alanine amidase